jgi:hypothetical protein
MAALRRGVEMARNDVAAETSRTSPGRATTRRFRARFRSATLKVSLVPRERRATPRANH